MNHKDFFSNINQWWNINIEGTTMYRVAKKLQEVNRKLKLWNIEVFKDVNRRKKELKSKLKQIEEMIDHMRRIVAIDYEEKEILSNLYNIIAREETHWK